MFRKLGCAVVALLALTPLPAQAHLQCVPYARSVSGVDIHGDAWTWWDQAEGAYQRGSRPQPNSVLVFQTSNAMPLGHVAVVRSVVDDRHVLLDHANWSAPGKIERGVLAEDVSREGDWSAVRVWYGPTRSLGGRSNPTYGFIYTASPSLGGEAIVSADRRSRSADERGDRAG